MNPSTLPIERVCNKCGLLKSIDEFNRRTSRGRKGYQYICRSCQKIVRSNWYKENRDHALAYSAEHGPAYMAEYRKRPEVQEREREYLRMWRKNNREQFNERGRRNNPARRARKREAFIEHVEPLVVLERDDGVCGICGMDVDPFDFHVDHVIPLSRDGAHSYSNVQVAHPRCNERKGAKLWPE